MKKMFFLENLGFYNFGACVIVADRTRHEHGDYMNIARINGAGYIKYYKDVKKIDPPALETIQKHAERMCAEFMQAWSKKTETEQWFFIMERLTIAEDLSIERGTPKRETIEKYKNVVFERL